MKHLTNSRNHFVFIFFALFVIFNSVGCKTAKKIQAAVDKKDSTSINITQPVNDDSILVIKNALKGVHDKQIDFKTFSAKVKVEYEDVNGSSPI